MEPVVPELLATGGAAEALRVEGLAECGDALVQDWLLAVTTPGWIYEFSSPRAKRAGPKGLRAESARAVTGRRNSHRWEGGRLFEPSAGFFYGNSCNSGTESRKIVSKVGN